MAVALNRLSYNSLDSEGDTYMRHLWSMDRLQCMRVHYFEQRAFISRRLLVFSRSELSDRASR